MTLSLRRSRRAAFTLFEILIVVALIALLAGVAITNVDRIFGQNQESIARIFVNETLKVPLTQYKIHMGSFPTTEEGLQALLTPPANRADRWRGPYLDTPGNRLPLDPWGNPYQYRYPGTRNQDKPDIWSWGPDGRESDDDIGNW
jgi:general secretion pathway protein G